MFQRRWHQPETRFIADRDPNNGKEYREFKWPGYPRRVRVEEREVATEPVTQSEESAPSPFVPTAVRATEGSHAPDHARRLTFRFLSLPSLVRYEIALKLGLLREEDDALSRDALFLEVFKRAVQAGLLAKLWDETEQRHEDQADHNPFQAPGE